MAAPKSIRVKPVDHSGLFSPQRGIKTHRKRLVIGDVCDGQPTSKRRRTQSNPQLSTQRLSLRKPCVRYSGRDTTQARNKTTTKRKEEGPEMNELRPLRPLSFSLLGQLANTVVPARTFLKAFRSMSQLKITFVLPHKYLGQALDRSVQYYLGASCCRTVLEVPNNLCAKDIAS